MLFITSSLNNLGQTGQGLVEYGLILILISVAAVVIMGVFGTELTAAYNDVTTSFSSR